jgi:hypothetical protein
VTRSVEETRRELERERAHLVEAAVALREEASRTFGVRERLGGHPLLVGAGALVGVLVVVRLMWLAVGGLLRVAGRTLQAALR